MDRSVELRTRKEKTMLLKKLGLLATVGFSSVLIACGPDCTSTCEQAQEDGNCFKETDGTGDVDCEKMCEAVEEIADEDHADCEDKLDDLISCVNDGDDACDAYNDDCDDERLDFGDCVLDFCTDHPNSDACEDYFRVIAG